MWLCPMFHNGLYIVYDPTFLYFPLNNPNKYLKYLCNFIEIDEDLLIEFLNKCDAEVWDNEYTFLTEEDAENFIQELEPYYIMKKLLGE